jgi:hypothetical protein
MPVKTKAPAMAPRQAAHAAEDDHQQHVARLVPGQQLRRHEAEHHRVQKAGHPAQPPASVKAASL